ncbi:MAG: hypothetical protein LAT64_00520 [Phycisphaerales bacterium]|nr:hypothetical protein [Planctomycetota bacterium]MCH8507245.1 hypothetical protein [Phycisphaerales bacterium]
METLQDSALKELSGLGSYGTRLSESNSFVPDVFSRRVREWLANCDVLFNRIDPHWREGGRSPGAMWHQAKISSGLRDIHLVDFNDLRSAQSSLAGLAGIVSSISHYNLRTERAPSPDNLGVPRCHFHRRPIQALPNRLFLIMPFSPEKESRQIQMYIKLVAGKVSGDIECVRADDLVGHDVMVDVYEGIASAGVVVAETTSSNPNVFLEIGIAITLGKPLILLTRDSLDTIPFDMRRFRHFALDLELNSLAERSISLSRALSETLDIPGANVSPADWRNSILEAGIVETPPLVAADSKTIMRQLVQIAKGS